MNVLAEAISGQQGGGFDLFAKVPHITFPGGKYLRSPLLALKNLGLARMINPAAIKPL